MLQQHTTTAPWPSWTHQVPRIRTRMKRATDHVSTTAAIPAGTSSPILSRRFSSQKTHNELGASPFLRLVNVMLCQNQKYLLLPNIARNEGIFSCFAPLPFPLSHSFFVTFVYRYLKLKLILPLQIHDPVCHSLAPRLLRRPGNVHLSGFPVHHLRQTWKVQGPQDDLLRFGRGRMRGSGQHPNLQKDSANDTMLIFH